MPVNDIITVNEYNAIRTKVVNVLGNGSGNSGYGQILVSNSVSVSNKVSVTDWNNLRFDITNAWVHQNGTTPSIITVFEGNTIRYSASAAPVTTYDTLADSLFTNRFSLGAGQSATVTADPNTLIPWQTSTTWPGAYGINWANEIYCDITVNFSTADQARYFFNSGGQIRISASRSGGAATSQNSSWTSILNAAGTQGFGGNNPGTGTSPSDGQNWYRLTNSFNQYYTTTGSSPYGANSYILSARCTDVSNNTTGGSKSAVFRVTFRDNYTDPGPPAPGDSVDGTFTVTVSVLYATGVLVPLGLGNFTVSIPTITLGNIAP